jgi:uncharacterized protein YggE
MAKLFSMKKMAITLGLLFSLVNAFAQNNNPFPKTITVTGSAELELVPDEIYVNVDLREYQKKGEDKKELETIKNYFLQACKNIGLTDSAISIVAYTGYNNYYYWRKKKKVPDMMASITYQVKFSNSKQMDALVEKLDDEATQNFVIARTSHSKITEYRKQLKIKAIQAAKEKAQYLAEAINEKAADAITITEPQEFMQSDIRSNMAYSNAFAKDSAGDKAMEVDFKKIKLRYEVNAVFALK